MNNNITATRLTLYAFISAIEMDLRKFIITEIPEENYNNIITQELDTKLTLRSKNDFCCGEVKMVDKLSYLDFGDCTQVINRYNKLLPNGYRDYFKEINSKFDKITPIRNRVMHSRPLEVEDMPIVVDFVEGVISSKANISVVKWIETETTYNCIKEDPSFVFGIRIPFMAIENEDKVLHNLPIVEFDDTGFIGRDTERKDIVRNILHGSYPVISIIGDGGVGKTALALRCLYDIVDMEEQPFDAIIWTTLKTKTLSNGEFKNIKDSITNTKELYDKIHNTIIGSVPSQPEDTLENIREFMSEFKVLLILDNLETINADNVREFLKSIPESSKVLITSRIGIGEFESREYLKGFEQKERVHYFRRLLDSYRIKNIIKMSDEDIDKKICIPLNSNPLEMKWFVINLCKGESIEKIMAKKNEITDYCMSNVYEKLSNDSKRMLNVLLVTNVECSSAELDYIVDLDTFRHNKAINELITTNMVSMKTTPLNCYMQTKFFVTEFAKEYLQQHCPPNNTTYKEIIKKFNSLKGLIENMEVQLKFNPYLPKSICATNKDEKIAAYYLLKSLDYSEKKDYDSAFKFIHKAKNAVPNYYENYKISAFIYASKNSLFEANRDYLTAIECCKDKEKLAPLQYLYAGFNLTKLEDPDKAMELCEKAECLDSTSFEIKSLKARILKQMKECEKADILFDKLTENAGELTQKNRRILIDQSIENLNNWVDEYLTKNQYKKVIEIISKINNKLNNFPKEDLDSKIYTTVSKSLIKCSIVARNYQEDSIWTMMIDILRKYDSSYCESKSREQLYNYLVSLKSLVPLQHKISYDEMLRNDLTYKINETNIKEGYVVRLLNGFGFIANQKYPGLFFHSSDCISDFQLLREGNKCSIEIKDGLKGKQAYNIKLLI